MHRKRPTALQNSGIGIDDNAFRLEVTKNGKCLRFTGSEFDYDPGLLESLVLRRSFTRESHSPFGADLNPHPTGTGISHLELNIEETGTIVNRFSGRPEYRVLRHQDIEEPLIDKEIERLRVLRERPHVVNEVL